MNKPRSNSLEYRSPGVATATTGYVPSLHVLALLTAAATFPLIFMGGLVTSHGAGMSVPDWPNSYGYNMFTFPPSQWVGGIFYEHTHRLMGTVVGFLSILLTIQAWRAEIANFIGRVLSLLTGGQVGGWHIESRHRRSTRWLCLGVLAAVIVQGVLGGLRVVLVELDLAVVHACFAQAFFCLAALACMVTSRWWIDAPHPSRDAESARGRRLIAACLFATGAIYAQLVAGALMRHYGAGLAIPDVPLAYGQLLPPISEGGVQQANALRTWTFHMDAVTASQIWLHFSHRVGAVVVSAAVLVAAWIVLRRHRDQPTLVRPAVGLLGLLVAQVTLGVLTVWLRKPADVASAHVAVGALTLVTAFVLTVRSVRLYGWSRAVVTAGKPVKSTPQPVAAGSGNGGAGWPAAVG
jgi:cytochrome c oxidase assembly protein subunit 15